MEPRSRACTPGGAVAGIMPPGPGPPAGPLKLGAGTGAREGAGNFRPPVNSFLEAWPGLGSRGARRVHSVASARMILVSEVPLAVAPY